MLHPGDVMDLAPHPDAGRHGGCCGPDGRVEVNRVCGCGAEAAIACADCTSGHEIRLMRDAVFPGSRSAFTAPWAAAGGNAPRVSGPTPPDPPARRPPAPRKRLPARREATGVEPSRLTLPPSPPVS